MENSRREFLAAVAAMFAALTGCAGAEPPKAGRRYARVIDAFPKLEVYLPHAGGTFPFLIGRLDYAIGVSPALKHMKQPAHRYLRRFYYDIITLDPRIMKMVIDLVGVDRVALGTDFPQLMGVKQPVDFVEQIPGLTQREREMILSDNPARLLKL